MAPDIDMTRTPSLLRRLGALVYDGVLLLGVLMLAVTILVIPYDALVGGTLSDNPLHRALLQLYLLVVIAGFYVYFWSHGGQTLGMRAWRMRVVREDGAALTGGEALKRFGWAALSLAPAGLGLWWVLIDREGLAWHDRLAHSRPVLLPRKPRD